MQDRIQLKRLSLFLGLLWRCFEAETDFFAIKGAHNGGLNLLAGDDYTDTIRMLCVSVSVFVCVCVCVCACERERERANERSMGFRVDARSVGIGLQQMPQSTNAGAGAGTRANPTSKTNFENPEPQSVNLEH